MGFLGGLEKVFGNSLHLDPLLHYSTLPSCLALEKQRKTSAFHEVECLRYHHFRRVARGIEALELHVYIYNGDAPSLSVDFLKFRV